MDSSKAFLLLFAAVLLLLSSLFILPFLQYFLLAVVLAYLLTPIQRRMEGTTGPHIAAASIVAATTVAIILPLVIVSRAVAADAAALIEALRRGDPTLDELEAGIERLTDVTVELDAMFQSIAANGGSGAFGSLLGVFGAVTHALIGLGLTLFLLYYFLKDRDDFAAWLRWVLPIRESVQDDLFDAIDGITSAVLAGHVLVAIIQGAIAGIGLVVADVPNALFWTAVMIVLALLPIVGSFLVWGPAAIYLALIGRPVAAVLLAAYGTVVVGVSDDYLRPVIVDRYAHVNPSVIIIGVLGGLYVIGFMGIFVGPIIIGALRATLDVYREQFESATDT